MEKNGAGLMLFWILFWITGLQFACDKKFKVSNFKAEN
jgi:hypothetical protein